MSEPFTVSTSSLFCDTLLSGRDAPLQTSMAERLAMGSQMRRAASPPELTLSTLLERGAGAHKEHSPRKGR